jgi:acyl dehydratase
LSLSDEVLRSLLSQVGSARPVHPWNTRATIDAIRHFALGIGDDNPLWWDEHHARAACGRMWAPPTFLYTGISGSSWPHSDSTRIPGLPADAMVLWAGDRWTFYSRLGLDETLGAASEVEDVTERPDARVGRAVTWTERTRFCGTAGRPLADLHRTLVVLERSSSALASRYADVPETMYSDTERRRILEQYLSEVELRRGSAQWRSDELRDGAPIGPMVKGPLTVTSLVTWLLGWGSPLCVTDRMASRFLASNPEAALVHEDTGVLDTIEAAHWDSALAQRSGFPRGYDFGAQRISWVAHLLTDWCGDLGVLTELDVRLLRPNFIGDTTWLAGTVVAAEQEGKDWIVRCELSGTNQRNELTTVGTASVTLPEVAFAS